MGQSQLIAKLSFCGEEVQMVIDGITLILLAWDDDHDAMLRNATYLPHGGSQVRNMFQSMRGHNAVEGLVLPWQPDDIRRNEFGPNPWLCGLLLDQGQREAAHITSAEAKIRAGPSP